MKLKVLFILPIVIFSALWWVPLAMAKNLSDTPSPDTPGFAESVDYQPSQADVIQKEITALEKELAELNNKLTDAENESNLKQNELNLADSKKTSACQTNSDGSVCSASQQQFNSAQDALIVANDAKRTAEQNLAAKQAQLDAKKAELAALQPQAPEVPSSQAAQTGPASINPNAEQGGTVLPSTSYELMSDCEVIIRYVDRHPLDVEKAIAARENIDLTVKGTTPTYTDVLGCAIKTGGIKLYMIPFFIRYILEFIIRIAGLASVGGIIYGGYLYLFAGLSDDQQKGKNAIKNSLIALVLSLSAWAIVNIVISLVTSL